MFSINMLYEDWNTFLSSGLKNFLRLSMHLNKTKGHLKVLHIWIILTKPWRKANASVTKVCI